jgi:hypothetical protein
VADLGGHTIEHDRPHCLLEIVGGLVAGDHLDPYVEDILSFDQSAEALVAVKFGHAIGKESALFGLAPRAAVACVLAAG